jgi:hypothetical protein
MTTEKRGEDGLALHQGKTDWPLLPGLIAGKCGGIIQIIQNIEFQDTI